MPEGGRPPSVAEQLVTSYDNAELLRHVPGHELPFPPEIRSALNELRELLFPGFSSRLGELRDMLFPGFTTRPPTRAPR